MKSEVIVFISTGRLVDVLEELMEEVDKLHKLIDYDKVTVTVFPSDDSRLWEGRLYYVNSGRSIEDC